MGRSAEICFVRRKTIWNETSDAEFGRKTSNRNNALSPTAAASIVGLITAEVLMTALGYLVPEFPNQTHAFFWREVQAMRAEGVKVVLLSTRTPAPEACLHDFAAAARAETRYLFPPSASALGFLAARPLRTAAALRYIAGLTQSSLKDRARIAAMLPSAATLCLQARANGVRHLHVHSCANSAHLAVLANILDDLPYSLTLHGDLEVYGTDFVSKFSRAVLVQAVTRPLRSQILEVAPEVHVPVITMGVDTDRFRPGPTASHAIPRFLSVARLNLTKGHVFFLRAMRQILNEGHALHYAVAGEGPAREMIEAEIAALGLEGQVTMLGSLSQDQVLEELQGADGFVLTSFGLGEAAPVAVMEAMAVGLPVICSRIGGTGDMITDDVDGLLVGQQDVTAIADALRRLVSDAGLRNRIGSAARERALVQFDARVMARALLGELGILPTGQGT
ncbi:MAG: glycosyltransferase [Tabrizicola sp.]|nr:glycosyltransferase [Tabrizicola sp.]